MTVLQSDIDALTDALASGERLVRKGDKTVEYRSIDEIIRARNTLISQKIDEESRITGIPRYSIRRLYHAGRGY